MSLRLPLLLLGVLPIDAVESPELPAADLAGIISCWLYGLYLKLPTNPIFVITGPPGSFKTSFARALVKLFESPDDDVTAPPTSPRNLRVVAKSTKYVLAIDNVEQVRWMPDELARIATGLVAKEREYYTNDKMVVFRPECGIIVTSISVPFAKGDVGTRMLVFTMSPQTEWLAESALRWPDFYDRAQESLVADLAVIKPLFQQAVSVRTRFRMGDFGAMVMAVFGVRGSAILETLRLAQVLSVVRDHPVVEAIIESLRDMPVLEGRASQLRDILFPVPGPVPEEARTAQALAHQLRLLAPHVSAMGIDITIRVDLNWKTNVYKITRKK